MPHGFVICLACGHRAYGDDDVQETEEDKAAAAAEFMRTTRKLKIDIEILKPLIKFPRGDHRTLFSKEARKAKSLDISARKLTDEGGNQKFRNYRHRFETDETVYPDGKTFRQQMEAFGRGADFVEWIMNPDNIDPDAAWTRKRHGEQWKDKRRFEQTVWKSTAEEERPLIPDWGSRGQGGAPWKWAQQAARTAAETVATAAAAAAYAPQGADAANSEVMVRKAGGLTAAFSNAMIKAGVSKDFASALFAMIVVLITILAWYGLYTLCSKIIKAANELIDKIKALLPAIELQMPTRRPITRTIGVQSQVHYTWHDTEPRFKARENGFQRSGEISIEPS
jgi:hypothetical protein